MDARQRPSLIARYRAGGNSRRRDAGRCVGRGPRPNPAGWLVGPHGRSSPRRLRSELVRARSQAARRRRPADPGVRRGGLRRGVALRSPDRRFARGVQGGESIVSRTARSHGRRRLVAGRARTASRAPTPWTTGWRSTPTMPWRTRIRSDARAPAKPERNYFLAASRAPRRALSPAGPRGPLAALAVCAPDGCGCGLLYPCCLLLNFPASHHAS